MNSVKQDKYSFEDKDKIKMLQHQIRTKEIELKVKEEELDRRQRLFDMQWKLLEHELVLLANEKEKFSREKIFYKKVNEFENKDTSFTKTSDAKLFFLGVHDELSLKKRYRDLLKLFHPDSMNGDVNAMQLINTEYDKLKQTYGI